MPPKPKFTREEIVSAALELVRQNGMEALTARELGNRMGSSARPIFTLFESMEEIRQEVCKAARQCFEDYTKEAGSYTPAIKQLGMLMIRFAMEEPKLYQLLFMQESKIEWSLREMLSERETMNTICVELLCKHYDLERQDAMVLFENIWVHTYGLGVLCATGACRFSEVELQEIVGWNFNGMLAFIKDGGLKEETVFPKEVL